MLHPTEKGYEAVSKINPQHAAFARKLEERIGKRQMAKILDAMTELRNTLEEVV